MANIVETFTGTNGATPAGWTSTGSGSATIQSNAFRIVSPATGTYVTERASRTGLANGDAVVDVLVSTLTEHYPEIVVRSSSATAYANGYALNLLPADGLIEISELTAGSRAALGSNAAFTFVAGNTYRVRFRWSGTSLQAKVWLVGDSEPGSWMIDTTDASVTAAGTLHLACTSGGTAGARTTTFDTLTVTDLDAVDNTMAGYAGNVGGAAGVLGANRAAAGYAPEVGGAVGLLAANRATDGIGPEVGSATGALAALRPLAGFGANVGSAVGTFNLNALSGYAGNVGSAVGLLAAVRPLAGYAPEVGSGAGLLAIARALDGYAPEVGSATGDVRASRALVGVAANVSSAGADLDATGPAQPLPLLDDPLPPALSGWRARAPTPYRPPTVVYA